MDDETDLHRIAERIRQTFGVKRAIVTIEHDNGSTLSAASDRPVAPVACASDATNYVSSED